MKRKYKVGLIVVLVFVVIGLAALYLIKKHKNQTNPTGPSASSTACSSSNSTTCKVDLASVTTAETTKTQIGSFGTPQAIQNNVYKNNTLGFQLTFSSVWQNAKVTETTPDAPAEGRVEFQIPTTDKAYSSGLATPLTIYVYKTANVPSSQSSPLLTKITASGDLVYTYVPWSSQPSDLGQFTEKEIGQVASTLKVLN